MAQYNKNNLLNGPLLPVDVVLGPEWWHKHAGICFDRDFFFHPARRVEDERRMEQVLYEKWGRFGLGKHHDQTRPELGAVHLAAGFFVSEMLGCQVRYHEKHPPQVVPADQPKLQIDSEKAFSSKVYRDFQKLIDTLCSRHGSVCGDVNWAGILNVALDLRGQDVFIDMLSEPDAVENGFSQIGSLIEQFVSSVQSRTGTSSISVNRNVRHFDAPVFLHSECSHTMISETDYERFLMPFDIDWSRTHRPFGIHYCGPDPHRYAPVFARLPHLDFLDVGWGGDIAILRRSLPNTFLNIRLSPVEIAEQSPDQIRQTITDLVAQSANPWLTGVCCINMDDRVTDQQVTAVFETVEELRRHYLGLDRAEI